MQCFAINPEEKKIEKIDIEMKADTLYSFFNSILIDEMPSIREHIIYADANALSQQKKPYFIGEQLVLGNSLIVGMNENMGEQDATIPQEALESIINYEVTTFYKDVLELLSQTDINLYRMFEVEKGDEKIMLNTEWVLYTYDVADERTRNYFKEELSKAIERENDVAQLIRNMAQLAMNAAG
ncbi:hypothetical protein [Sulfurimonas paralvinellae]|uniref:Uncharacterized protein n=1 Tax=Sulfurimonas paralvinellae TaxID=317658 RepID=A0A7M1B5G2_9BACT|nr:hypothetical protein [Sulfurimonas paralvinellae]QOP44910.1 hypothetical protein FM071_00805 [Sulfurimonas paralvinellae]